MLRRAVLGLAALALVLSPVSGAYTPPPVPQGAWTTYTPTVSASSPGATPPTFSSVSGRSQVTGKRVDWYATLTVATAGTGAGVIQVSLPFTPVVVTPQAGAENSVSPRTLKVLATTGGVAVVTNTDNTYPGATGAVIYVSGSYEAQ